MTQTRTIENLIFCISSIQRCCSIYLYNNYIPEINIFTMVYTFSFFMPKGRKSLEKILRLIYRRKWAVQPFNNQLDGRLFRKLLIVVRQQISNFPSMGKYVDDRSALCHYFSTTFSVKISFMESYSVSKGRTVCPYMMFVVNGVLLE